MLGILKLLAKRQLNKKNQGILDLLTRKRDLKNYKEFIPPGATSESGRMTTVIPHFVDFSNRKKPLNINLYRGESNVPSESLKTGMLHGFDSQPGGYYSNQIMKALDYAEGAPFDRARLGANYKPQDNLGVIRRGKFTGSTDDLMKVNAVRNYTIGPEVNLPPGTIDDKVALIPSIIARMRMRPEFKQTSLPNYIRQVLKEHKGDLRLFNKGGIASL
jgi:hypothetical protein